MSVPGYGNCWGASIDRRVAVHHRCRLDRPWGLRLGERVCLEPDVCLKLVKDNAKLSIGAFTFIGAGTRFDVIENVKVGEHTLIAPGCFITDHNHNFRDTERRIDQQGVTAAPIIIGSDVWLGAGVTVLPGVTIENGVVVGAGAVVTDDIPAYSIAVSVPTKIIGQRQRRKTGAI